MKKTKHIIQAATPRLSDEDLDPIEQDESDNTATLVVEGWLPWDPEDIADIKRLIADRMPKRQKFIILSFLEGLTYEDLDVTEKYWRYHFNKGVEFIKKELKI